MDINSLAHTKWNCKYLYSNISPIHGIDRD